MYNGVYPVGVTPYTPQIKKRKIEKVEPEEQSSQKPHENEESEQQETGSNRRSNINYQQSSSINISQILVDFKNTLNAIGAPEDVQEEVTGYLSLVEKQSTKEAPSSKVIISNLKNASDILDEHISKSLGKHSRVVKDWIDALLLQKVDYKADPSIQTGTLKIPDSQKTENTEPKQKAETTNETQDTKTIPAPQAKEPQFDSNIQKAILKAKKLETKGEREKALGIYAKALKYSYKINDKKAQAAIFLNAANVQDSRNKISESLKCFNSSAKASFESKDTITRAKAHAGMGKIYDEMGYFNNAMEHYFTALSFDGENENLGSQAQVLNNIGKMFTSRFEHKEALEFFKLSFGIAKQIPDIEAMGSVLSNTAGVFKETGLNSKALKYYGDAIKLDNKVGKTFDAAKNYEQAGDIMFGMKKYKKALDLYNKSFKKASKVNEKELIARVSKKINNLQFQQDN